MKSALRLSVVIIAIAVSSVTVRASSWPIIAGQVSGIELCPQAWCGVAVFSAIFKGQVGFIQNTLGTIAVGVHHGPLPVVEDACTPIFPDSVWTLKTLFRKFEGVAAGELCYDGGNRFNIDVDMQITSGGFGPLHFEGTLDHNVFPPTVKGHITQ
jgi:hypothetical protein